MSKKDQIIDRLEMIINQLERILLRSQQPKPVIKGSDLEWMLKQSHTDKFTPTPTEPRLTRKEWEDLVKWEKEQDEAVMKEREIEMVQPLYKPEQSSKLFPHAQKIYTQDQVDAIQEEAFRKGKHWQDYKG